MSDLGKAFEAFAGGMGPVLSFKMAQEKMKLEKDAFKLKKEKNELLIAQKEQTDKMSQYLFDYIQKKSQGQQQPQGQAEGPATATGEQPYQPTGEQGMDGGLIATIMDLMAGKSPTSGLSLMAREGRNKQLHGEAGERIAQAKRRNDIAQANYEREFNQWTPVKTKNAEGQEVTIFMPKFMKPGDMGMGGRGIVTRPASGTIKPQALPPAVRTEVATLQTLIDELQFVKKGVKPNYLGAPGLKKSGALKVAGFAPFDISDPDYAVWSMIFESLKAIERHEKFGAAFTSTEAKAFKKMFPAGIRSYKDFMAQIQATIDFSEKKKGNILKTHAAPRDVLLGGAGKPKTAEDFMNANP